MRLQTILTACLALAVMNCGSGSDALRDNALPAICSETDDRDVDNIEDVSESARPVLISNATVMTATGQVFEPGFVLLGDGRIVSVSGERPTELPSDTWEIDATGRYVTPGIIDSHSHLGVYPAPHARAHSDGNEATSPFTPQVQAVHSVWPQDPNFMRAIAGGVTTLQVLPGSANIIGGRGVTLRNRRGARSAEDLRFVGAPDGLKMACGENPKTVYGDRGAAPSTRMASIAMLRNVWIEAERYREQRREYEDEVQQWCENGAPEDDEPDEPNRHLGNETLAAVLDGEILVHMHCYRADEMLLQIEVAEEFGYQIRTFEHAVEAYKIRDVLAEQNIGACTWADWWGFKLEAFDAIVENAGLVSEAGAPVIIHSDSSIGIQRLNQEAAKAFYTALDAGVELTEDDALRWITLNPAWALGVDDRTGSIEPGKLADIVIWSAHPFSVYARADIVFVGGSIEYERANADEPWSDFELGLWPQEVDDAGR